MFKTVTKNLRKYSAYKLCYVDSIPRVIYKATPETEEYYKTDEFKRFVEENGYGHYNPKVVYKNYPNADYNWKNATHFAYFTPLSLSEQWGDDWNDSPINCNAEVPYDDCTRDGKREEITIIQVPFAVHFDDEYNESEDDEDVYTEWESPDDISRIASVEKVNCGKICPWISCYYNHKYLSIFAGVNPYTFMKQINDFKKLVSEK